jgi:hypothetical protein
MVSTENKSSPARRAFWIPVLALGALGEAAPTVVPATAPTTAASASTRRSSHADPPFREVRAEERTKMEPPVGHFRLQILSRKPPKPFEGSPALYGSLPQSNHRLDVEAHSWTDAKTAIENISSGSSGTITLATDFNCNYTNSSITIVGDVTVRGNGAICDGKQGGGFFTVASGARLALDAMTLKNGNAGNVSQRRNDHHSLTTELSLSLHVRVWNVQRLMACDTNNMMAGNTSRGMIDLFRARDFEPKLTACHATFLGWSDLQQGDSECECFKLRIQRSPHLRKISFVPSFPALTPGPDFRTMCERFFNTVMPTGRSNLQ